jgi:hypothetical protein
MAGVFARHHREVTPMPTLPKPSSSTVIALVALVFAMTGSAAAVVNFARNAGAVDGKSAVPAGVKPAAAAGKLVTTRRVGAQAGTVPISYLDPATGRSQQFGQTTDVIDNGGTVPFTIASIPGFGTLQATCGDQSNTAGNEDPTTTISFVNTSGAPVNFARTVGGAGGSTQVLGLVPNQAASFAVNGSNTYVVNLNKPGTTVLVNGVVRQDGAGTAAASCVNWGEGTQAS